MPRGAMPPSAAPRSPATLPGTAPGVPCPRIRDHAQPDGEGQHRRHRQGPRPGLTSPPGRNQSARPGEHLPGRALARPQRPSIGRPRPRRCAHRRCGPGRRAARSSSSPPATVTVSAEYDSPAHGSSFQVVSKARVTSRPSSGRSAAARDAQVCRRPGQGGQARLGATEGVQNGLDLARRVGCGPGPELSGTLCTAEGVAGRVSGTCSLALCARPARCQARWQAPGTGGAKGRRRSTARGTATMAASPAASPSSVSTRTPW